VRRKDITQLFLGTGLGSRSYAIIEQGMISRVIEARPDDLRAFLEEAAGISRYKERRRETENRIGQTRENLDRLNDLREEVEKQIRHLQRQAATARRYQTLKEEERKLQAELLALRLQSLDAEAGIRDAATEQLRDRHAGVLADLREVEAEIEQIRADQSAKSETLGAIQARFYEAGAEVTRIEQSIQYARELRQRQRSDTNKPNRRSGTDRVLQRDRGQLEALSEELATMMPALDEAHAQEARLASPGALRAGAGGVAATWDDAFAGGGARPARDRRWNARASSSWRASSGACCSSRSARRPSVRLARECSRSALELLAERRRLARDAGQRAASELQELLAEMSVTREREREQAQALNALRARWQQALGTQVSTEALQQAALGKASGKVTQWLKSKSLDTQPRVAQQLRVDRGWERAVETVLGSYLEAVCVDGLDSVTDSARQLRRRPFGRGHAGLRGRSRTDGSERRRARCRLAAGQGAGRSRAQFGVVVGVHRRDLGRGAGARRRLTAGESVVTRDGIWLGPDWLRVSRDADPHTGVIEREESLREIAQEVTRLAEEVKESGASPGTHPRARARARGSARSLSSRGQPAAPRACRSARRLDSAQARTADAARRVSSSRRDWPTCAPNCSAPRGFARGPRPHGNRHRGAGALEPKRVALEEDRERLRTEQGAARVPRRPCNKRRGNWPASRIAPLLACVADHDLARIEKQLETLERGATSSRHSWRRARRPWRGCRNRSSPRCKYEPASRRTAGGQNRQR
jgi:chromosome segregation protein